VKVICAPDSFKDALRAAEAAKAMARGILHARPDAVVDLCPIADGGEGTVEALVSATGGTKHVTRVTGPRGEACDAVWGMLGGVPEGERTAVIEMAAASGLELLAPDQRDPTQTTTFGTGQLIRTALDAGVTRLIIGIGGSATNDGGCGMAAALGARFLDHHGHEVTPLVGGTLDRIARIDLTGLDPRLAHTTITVACDVTNPLTGLNGASRVYGPQKGATPEQIERLDANLRHLAVLWHDQLGRDVETMPGAGAAGGLGAGLVVFCGATLQRGIDLVLDVVRFDERVRDATLCLTGEGRLDGQSLAGKAVLGVARAAAKHYVPTIALVGSAADDAGRTLAAGLTAYHVLAPGLPRDESIRRTAELLETVAAKVVTRWSRILEP